MNRSNAMPSHPADCPVAAPAGGGDVHVCLLAEWIAARSRLPRSICSSDGRTRAMPANTRILEARVSPASALAGRTLREAALPPGTLVVSIARDGEVIFPQAGTRIAAGDLLSVLTTPQAEPALRMHLTTDSER